MDSHPSEAIPGTNHIVPVTKISQEKKSQPDRFSQHQLRELWARFEVTPYLTTEQVQSLSSQLGLTTLQVRNWFRNQRKKYKLWIASRHQTPVPISGEKCTLCHSPCMYKQKQQSLILSCGLLGFAGCGR
ncbi:homeobox protein NANOG-like [Ornithorhynchus anatinus]|uniref:homeobox protein NANOG-like n=1 Tax=Ornithorhynchus anatinus TaxID=9258 RepID=UPI0019D4C0E5|nr:homeobox protein NANOG-like [Ornithorhynchus anatinus]